MKLTISEYAKSQDVSVQTIYKRVKRGGLKTFKENGITYVIVEKDGVKPRVKRGLNPSLKSDSKELFKIINKQQKEIKRLTIKLEECNSKKEEVYLSYIVEQKNQKIQLIEHDKNQVPGIKSFWQNLWKSN